MTGSPKVRLRTGSVDWREVDGEIVVLESRTSTYLAINRSAATLWHSIVAGTDRDQLIEQLATGYGLDRAAAAADVDRFLAELAARDLLEQ